jgi:hypothetical protein
MLMVTGRLYDEATILRVALAYERASTWNSVHPNLTPGTSSSSSSRSGA